MTESIVDPSMERSSDLTEAPMQVLNVDDDVNFLNITKQILEVRDAFQVDKASSADEAMKKLKEKTYDAVVSDYYMPGKDGLAFLKELRESGNTIPFILFTGKGREEVVVEALNLGADQYFNKIGDPEAVYSELTHGIRQAIERRKADMDVWKQGERLRAILASSPDIITVSDLQGNIVDCNEAAWKLSGFSSKEELLGKSSFEFIAEKDRKRAMDSLKKTFQEGTTGNIEYTLLRKGGEEYAGELSASILKDSSGHPIGFVGVVRDITERKKAGEALQKSERGWVDSFNSLEDVMLIINVD